MNKNLIKNLIFIILSFVLIVESVIIFIIKINLLKDNKNNEVGKDNIYIVHASGDVSLSNGQTYKYTNTIDNFDMLYSRGYRYFEYDFVFSSDNNIISCHEYEYLEGYDDANKISYNDFVNYSILGELKGVTIELLLQKLDTYKDFYIILDTKENDAKSVYDMIESKIENYNSKYLKNFIPQLYSDEMWNQMKDSSNYESYIFTNYKIGYSAQEILNKFSDNRIKFITMPQGTAKSIITEVMEYKKVLLHTINNKEIINQWFNLGIFGIYTDNVNLF